MKIVRPIMLAAIVVVAAMAFIGASSASAAHPVIQLCKAQELLLCATGNLIKHPLKGTLLLSLGKFAYKGLFTITCTSGVGHSAELEFAGSGKVDLTLAELNLSGCEGGCKVFEVAKNQTGKVTMSTEGGEDWYLEAPTMRFKFSSDRRSDLHVRRCPQSRTQNGRRRNVLRRR